MALTTLDGRYHVLERMASGGMGEVYRAHDAVLAREVAIKVLHRSLAGDPGFVDRFRREARAAAGLNHPNIVAVYDWGAVDGIYFMVMEFIRGESLRDLLNANARLEPAQAAGVLLQVLSALEHAHRQGIVHRDMKPENVMVDRDSRAKVADFGLARAYADSKATQVGTVTGTAQYLAPEQIRGEPADPRSDLYSLGIVAYELLTGRLPFSGETAMAIAYKHLSERVQAPSRTVQGLPKGLDGFVLSATERDRELRPESAAEMRRDLEAEARSLPPARPAGELVGELQERVVAIPDGGGPAHADTVTIPRTEARRTRRKRARRRIVGALIAVAALAAAAWAAWTYLIPHTVAVPDVLSEPVEDAQAALADAGFQVRIARGEYSLDLREGRVLAVNPPPGTELEEGARVTLVPSLGPQPVDIPDLRGMTIASARRELKEAGLVLGDQKEAFHDEIPEDHIVKQVPPVSDGTAPEGSEVDVWLSKGPPPVEVPDVRGETAKAATKALRAKGFVPLVEEEFSDKVDKGHVISQEFNPGEEIPKGSEVTIVVSRGPEQFPAPDFTGLTKKAAEELADEYGLRVAFFQVPGTSGSTVLSQLPVAGVTVSYGAAISLYLA